MSDLRKLMKGIKLTIELEAEEIGDLYAGLMFSSIRLPEPEKSRLEALANSFVERFLAAATPMTRQ